MSKYLVLAILCLGALPIAMSAEGGAAPAAVAMDCCNTVCPVCGKPIDAKIAVKGFKSEHGAKHPELKDALVGFDSKECMDKFLAAPSNYEENVWNQYKTKQVK